MHATIRRYNGVDQNRTAELTGKVNETLVPKLCKLPGFKGYYLIEAGERMKRRRARGLGGFESCPIRSRVLRRSGRAKSLRAATGVTVA
jgi:hypothetical protein